MRRQSPSSRRFFLAACSLLSCFALGGAARAQQAQMSVVTGAGPFDLAHVGVATDDPSFDRCAVFESFGNDPAWQLFGARPALHPLFFTPIAVVQAQSCPPPGASEVGFRYDFRLPHDPPPPGFHLHLQAVLYTSANPSHRTATNLVSLPFGLQPNRYLAWSVERAGSGPGGPWLDLRRIAVDTGYVEAPVSIPAQEPALSDVDLSPPAVSPDDESVAIPVRVSDALASSRVYVLRHFRSTQQNQLRRYWIPLPADDYRPVGGARFDPNDPDRLWLIQEHFCATPRRAYRLARYELTDGGAVLVGQAELEDPAGAGSCVTDLFADEWEPDATGAGLYVISTPHGAPPGPLHLRHFSIGGGLLESWLLSSGSAIGPKSVRRVAADSPYALVQYAAGLASTSSLRFLDLGTAVLGAPFDAGAQHAHLPSDGTYVLYELPGAGNLDAELRRASPPFDVFGTLTGFFCHEGDEMVAADGPWLVGAASQGSASGCPVQRVGFDAQGTLVHTFLCNQPGNGLEFAYDTSRGPYPPALRVAGRNAIDVSIDDGSGTSDVLQRLDVETMTWASLDGFIPPQPAVLACPGRFFF